MEAQWRFFRSKSVCDYCVLASLGCSLLFQAYAWSIYIDTLFSFVLSGFLVWSAYMIAADSMYDLLDRALDESLQVEINRLLVAHFDAYDDLHGVRTRRAGGQVYIEVFLEFDGTKADGRRADGHQSVDRRSREQDPVLARHDLPAHLAGHLTEPFLFRSPTIPGWRSSCGEKIGSRRNLPRVPVWERDGAGRKDRHRQRAKGIGRSEIHHVFGIGEGCGVPAVRRQRRRHDLPGNP